MRTPLPISPQDLVQRIRQNVPVELRERPQWTLWKIKDYRKIPLSPVTRNYASCTDESTWATFDHAAALFLRNTNVARGFNVATGCGVGGLDLDTLVSEDGRISQSMRLLLDHLDSYTELSPSGTGLHSFFLCDQEHESRKAGTIELYCSKHFLSVTGDVYEGRRRLRTADIGVERILKAIAPPKPLLPRIPLKDIPENDHDLLEKMFVSRTGGKIRRLWDGEVLHKSPSESDYSLMSYLGYWCGGDTNRMIALFLTSARAERAKGQRVDYLQRMAQKVVSK